MASPATWDEALKTAGWPASRIPYAKGIINRESGGDAKARNTNSDQYSSVDRGGWQINNHWHPEVTDACADDPVCSSRAALRISKGGTSFAQWATNGAPPIFAQPLPIKNGGKGGGGILGSVGDALSFSGADALGINIPNPLSGIDAVAGALKEFVGFFASLFEASTWFRILKVVGGVLILAVSTVALVQIAVKSFTSSSKPNAGKALTKAAKVVPTAKAVGKVAKFA